MKGGTRDKKRKTVKTRWMNDMDIDLRMVELERKMANDRRL